MGHVGDSRAYSCRGRDLRRLTLTTAPDPASAKPWVSGQSRRTLHGSTSSRMIGCVSAARLTDLVDNDTIAEILAADEGVDGGAGWLVGEAMSRGGFDNLTVLLIDVGCQRDGPSE